MTVLSRLVQAPVAFDPDAGRTAACCIDIKDAEALIMGAAGSAPYLARLIEAEADWLRPAFFQGPQDVMTELLVKLEEECSDLSGHLRKIKRRAALWIALMDLGGVWSLEEVTGALTRLADAALGRAVRFAIEIEWKRGSFPGQTEADLEDACGFIVLAMGKMGAFELNYSSDIDLICLFDETRFEAAAFSKARQGFIRATRLITKTLSQQTEYGYVFRTDLRLRPDPAVTPVCVALEAAERYYESLGRTWERAAYIKARPAAGDITAGVAFLDRLTPFVYRRHLDFAAIEDAHNMRLKIRESRALGGPIEILDHNLKLGRGGIREIEFFAQTRQLIAGGRDRRLQVRGTVQALDILAQTQWISQDIADKLARNYRVLRGVEHRLQMVQDAQTHILPKSQDELRRIAYLSGESDVQIFEQKLQNLFKDTEAAVVPLYRSVATDDHNQNGPAQDIQSDHWLSYPALRTARARILFDKIRPKILSALSSSGRFDDAMINFENFLKNLPAGVQLFSLFAANPSLIDLIADICSVAPELARYLSRNAHVFDAVLDGDFFEPVGSVEVLHFALQQQLRGTSDYEVALDLARRWQKDVHFKIGVQHLRGLISGQEAGQAYARLAEAVVRSMWPLVHKAFVLKHGTLERSGAVVMGMGSLGAGVLHARSDLDLVIVYDVSQDAISNGDKPLPARLYYARLTQALLAALSAKTAEGRLYEVDMRLRPSGRQGPVAVSFASFEHYQKQEAWVWEHLALVRGRVIAGPSNLSVKVETVRRNVLRQSAETAMNILVGLEDMRHRLAHQDTPQGAFGFKHGAGKMLDIELAAQAHVLLAGEGPQDIVGQLAVEGPLLPDTLAKQLLKKYFYFNELNQISHLVSANGIKSEDWPRLLEKFNQKTTFDPIENVQRHSQEAAQSIGAAIARCKRLSII